MLKIDQKIISPDTEPLIIAEMSGNHNQSLERALEIVDAAADCGVDALKLQTYTADTMTLDIDKTIQEQFNLLRIVDNEKYPAFFDFADHRYVLRIEKYQPNN
jgi:sialic acid synthase SpsE